MTKAIKAGNISIGNDRKLSIIAGPCVIEPGNSALRIAKALKKISASTGIGIIFKASFDKANRSAVAAFRGPGLLKGLKILNAIKKETGMQLCTDIHEPSQAGPAGRVADILQVPAFLCRQTDLIKAAAETGKILNLKKGQFMSPWEMENAIGKAVSCGNRKIIITERGTTFGYNNLVVDFRSFQVLKTYGYPVFFDATHSLQLPGAGKDGSSGGSQEFISGLAKPAVAAGIAGVFIEVHPNPGGALSDGANMLGLNRLEALLKELKKIDSLVKKGI